MLKLTRQPGESVHIGDDLVITLADTTVIPDQRAKVRLRIDGPHMTGFVSLEKGQSVRLAPEVTAEFVRPRKRGAVLGIDAPIGMTVLRAELAPLAKGGPAC
jgi:sRNA-binding carbon storage regulator CsrA